MADDATKARLIAAAADLFAERGFHGTKVRDIAARAGANVAAGHYHYGSKKDLYVEVMRAQFADIRRRLEVGGGLVAEADFERLSPAGLRELLRRRCQVMLELLLGPPPGVHSTLMMREMSDPSEAMPVIVGEFVAPLVEEMRRLIARLEPALSRRQVELVTFSIAGQAYFYRLMMPAILMMLGIEGITPALRREIAAHVADFSLGGIAQLAAPRRKRRKGKR